MSNKFDAIKTASARQPHGTRARYAGGCRCVPCRAANSRYESARLRARREGDTRGIVDAAKAREHIERLSALGVGRRTIAEASGVSATIISMIKSGERQRIRAHTERQILAVTDGDRADGSLVDAGPTWRRIRALLNRGYSKATLAKMFGSAMPAIQINAVRIKAATAFRIQALCDAIEAGSIRRP